jgi:hypothetical protein
MSEWWTYSLADFLMFAPRTYYRMIELYNLAIWPVQLVGVAIGLGIATLLAGKRHVQPRIINGLLSGCWLWIALAFHWQRYAQINWAASWFAAAFALEALLLLGCTVTGRLALAPAGNGNRGITASLFLITVLGYPLLAPLTGRMWTTAETFGVTADPTAIATVVAVGSFRGRLRWLLLLMPVLWCAVAAATLWTMDAPEAFVMMAATVVALASAVWRRRGD